jgi:hypothetical protein
MKQKTFFTLSAIIFILLVGFFSIKLASLPQKSCVAYFNYVCDAEAQLICGGDEYMKHHSGSTCDGEVCVGIYDIFCGWNGPYSPFTDTLTCYDNFNFTCANN